MNITLTVVVSAIVILITALVVITIFGGSMGNIGTATSADSICEASCASSCKSLGVQPITWNAETVKDSSGKPVSCLKEYGACDCSKYTTTNNNPN